MSRGEVPRTDEILALLGSRSPSTRLSAALQLALPLDDEERRQVLEYLQGESVPIVRAALEKVLAAREAASVQEGSAGPASVDHGSGEDIAKLISHELLPALGRARLDASIEIENFDGSKTSRALDRLSRRLSAVIKIASARRDAAVVVDVNALEVVQECAEASLFPVDVEVAPDSAGEEDFIVRADLDLMSMLLDAAITNAGEAQASVNADSPVGVEVNSMASDVIVTVTNQFAGISFEKATVAEMGRTTRYGGRGTGVRVIEGAAAGLNVDWNIRGTSGVALFTVRFPRR